MIIEARCLRQIGYLPVYRFYIGVDRYTVNCDRAEALRFHLVPDATAKDVALYTRWKEVQAYSELMAQDGIHARDQFFPTRFTGSDYTDFLRTRVELAFPGMPEHDYDAGTQGVDLFPLRDHPRFLPFE